MSRAKIVGYALVALLVGGLGYYITAVTAGLLLGFLETIGKLSVIEILGNPKYAVTMEMVAGAGGLASAWLVVGRRCWMRWKQSQTNSKASLHTAEGT